jgi:hypothetical protein
MSRCEQCGEPFEPRSHRGRRPRFCSATCRYRARDARKYREGPEGERAKSRAYYRANRERVIARVQARHREREREAA